ncbi:hypothetical protein [Dongia rigui]|uniref:Uncharacterized protein n=1 Tax=Dongia rigui TaxID=940149 RepID=A0ABU5DVJ7_9PROT|nr:hypothetical protein [Dongia rigui]MDY0871315.1 hypothetical protein [Dongia rigui]
MADLGVPMSFTGRFFLSMLLRVPLYIGAGTGLGIAEFYSWRPEYWAYEAAPFGALAILALADTAIFSDVETDRSCPAGMFFICLAMEGMAFLVCYFIANH